MKQSSSCSSVNTAKLVCKHNFSPVKQMFYHWTGCLHVCSYLWKMTDPPAAPQTMNHSKWNQRRHFPVSHSSQLNMWTIFIHKDLINLFKLILLKLKLFLRLSNQDNLGQSLDKSGSSTEADGLPNTTTLQDQYQYLPPQWPRKTGAETLPDLRKHDPLPDWSPV